MAEIIETTQEHGKIDLTHLLKPMIECLKDAPECFLQESKGKFYVITKDIIRRILDDQKFVSHIRREGRLFSNTEYAGGVAALDKNEKVSESQMKLITELEDVIYEHLKSLLNGKPEFGQNAASWFDALNRLTGKNIDTDTPRASIFPDAALLKKYPGTKAILRIPHHTVQINGDIAKSLETAIKDAVRIRLSEEFPDDEFIDEILGTVDKDLKDNIGRLNEVLEVFDRDAYGRIRRTYACCVLRRMAKHLPENSPAIAYVKRVDEFNEFVQGTLPGCELSPDDFILEFPQPDGKGIIEFDLMTEFSRAHAFDILPFWIAFDDLLSEVAFKDTVTTTIGQRFKMNGKVPAKGFGTVYEFNVDKLEKAADALKKGDVSVNIEHLESLRKILRIAVLYHLIFRDNSKNVLTNYQKLKTHLENLLYDKISLDEILTKIAARLKKETILSKNKQIREDFKKLLTSRKLDNQSVNKQKLWLIIDRDILSDVNEMEKANPVVLPPSDYVTGYLRFLKVTRHPDAYDNALNNFNKNISFTELLHYLTSSDTDNRIREMKRDKARQVTGVLFTPYDMLRLSHSFNGLTQFIISYDRNQLHGVQTRDLQDFQSDSLYDKTWLAGLAQLIHVILVYGILKAIARTENNNGSHADKTMLLILSLFSTSSLIKTSEVSETAAPEKVFQEEGEEKRGFTHDAHKAVEHVIQQHMPSQSQGFKLTKQGEWDKLVQKSRSKDTSFGIKDAASVYLQRELRDYRFGNIATGLFSGLDALWRLPHEPGIKKIALVTVTSRSCDRLGKRSDGDQDILFGNIHRFEYETNETAEHFYRYKPVQAFCDDINSANRFKNPSVLFHTIRGLYSEGFRDVMMITKVPFTRRIRMTLDEDSTYANPMLLEKLNEEMPDIRVYPLFTQKSYGIRLSQTATQVPLFLPYNAAIDTAIEAADKSTLFRAASVITYRVVEGGKSGEKLHSGITDYLFRCYPRIIAVQSKAISAITTPGSDQDALYEILRFLHAVAYQKNVFKKKNEDMPRVEAKLDALDTIIGEKSVGQQANVLEFPKSEKIKGNNAGMYKFPVNIIALLRHLEKQSDFYRKSSGNRKLD